MSQVKESEHLARLKLAAALPSRPGTVLALQKRWGSADEALRQTSRSLAGRGDLTLEEAEQLRKGALVFDAEKEARELERLGGRVVFCGTPDFPDRLAAIPDPPALLYLLGEMVPLPAVAIVGTRRPTPYGRRMASQLSRDAAHAGLAVVSGLARGIDTVAHIAAVEAEGATWAVLGSGLCRPYPPENRRLIRRILDQKGAVLTEHPLWTPPARENFPRRNRIISGLSFGTVVVEGAFKSGALITARCSLDQGREVFAVPGPAESEMSRGPHHLIQQGAKLVGSFRDILEEIAPWHVPSLSRRALAKGENGKPAAPSGGALAPEDGAHQAILEAIGEGAKAFDEISVRLGWAAAPLSEALLELELRGWVESLPGKRYARKK